MTEVVLVFSTLAALTLSGTLSGTLTTIAQIAPLASPAPAPVSVTVSVGRGQTWDDEGSIGSGTSAGGGVEWRFRPKWSIGAEIERLGHERDTTSLQFSGRTVFASANLTYRFAARGVTPYVGGGFGGAFYKGTLVDRFNVPPQTIPRSSTSTMAYGSAGVEIPIGDRFAISPDVRITMCQPQDDFAPWSTIRFGVKASVRF
jgi:hypothetical protein